MTVDQGIEFIMTKLALIAEHAILAAEREEVLKMAAGMDDFWGSPRLNLKQLTSLDSEMIERCLDHYVSNADEATIRRRLIAQFKTSRLRDTDTVVTRRVLKRGSIATAEEYLQLKALVEEAGNVAPDGENDLDLIRRLLARATLAHAVTPEPTPPPVAVTPPRSRRRPLPPFDLTLPADEKLCPPETPLETRTNFVRAKFELVIEQIESPPVREALENALRFGLQRSLGPDVKDEDRNAALEWVEHEAEFFAGHQVSGTIHRKIEVELERQFGFRRLGPSAQARLARMLATLDALGRDNRLFIDRFIYAYPHQTLFNRKEMALARRLLKAPSPSLTPPPPQPRPRPKSPPDMSLLCVGALFELPQESRPHRVIAFDAIEVFYDVEWGTVSGNPEAWTFGSNRRRAIYYRSCTPLFLDGAKRLGVDEPTREYLALHRPDLPLRFGRSANLNWEETPFESRDEFRSFVEKVDPALLAEPPLNAPSIVILPRSRRGALQAPVLVTADMGATVSVFELLWEAHRVQRPIRRDPLGGVGFYRAGLHKNGTPSFFLDGFMDGSMNWHAGALPT